MRIRSSARTAVLTGVVAFLALQFVLDRLLDGLWRPFYHQRVSGIRRAIREAGDGCLVVMLGSSRTTHGLRGDVIGPQLARELGAPVVVYNAGIPGDGPVMNLLTLRRLLDDDVRPELLLVEVLPAMLSGGNGIPGDIRPTHLATDSMRYDELSFLRHYSRARRPVDALEWWLSRLTPIYHLRTRILSALQPRLLPREDQFELLPEEALGWVPIDSPLNTPRKRPLALAAAKREYVLQLRRFKPNEPSIEATEELLKLCRQEQIRVALVLMPEGPVFRSWYSRGVRSGIHRLLDTLARRHGAPVVDARAWMNDEKDFLDSHHLLPAAAEAFSRQLGEQALLPLLRQWPERGSWIHQVADSATR